MGLFNIFGKTNYKKEKPHYEMPGLGKICEFNGVRFVVLTYKKSGYGSYVHLDTTVRELFTGKLAKIVIGWHTNDDTYTYTTKYYTNDYSPGASYNPSEVNPPYYTTYTNVIYKNYECQRIFCLYNGDYSCTDEATNQRYVFNKAEVLEELQRVKKGAWVSVYLFEGQAYYGACYKSNDYGICRYKNENEQDYLINIDTKEVHKIIRLTKDSTFSLVEEELYHYVGVKSLDKNANSGYYDELNSAITSLYIPVYPERMYGYIEKGKIDDPSRKLIFTDYKTGKEYEVFTEKMSDDTYGYFCNQIYFVQVVKFARESVVHFLHSYLATICEGIYLYDDGEYSFVMDDYTYETYKTERYRLPKNIEENDCVDYMYVQDSDLKHINEYGEMFYFIEEDKEIDCSMYGEPEVIYTFGGEGDGRFYQLNSSDPTYPHPKWLGKSYTNFMDYNIKEGERVYINSWFDPEEDFIKREVYRYRKSLLVEMRVLPDKEVCIYEGFSEYYLAYMFKKLSVTKNELTFVYQSDTDYFDQELKPGMCAKIENIHTEEGKKSKIYVDFESTKERELLSQ